MLIDCKKCLGAGGWCEGCNQPNCECDADWTLCDACGGSGELEDPDYAEHRAQDYADGAADYFHDAER